MVASSLSNCLADSVDRAAYGGHLYSDKAPGLAALALPAVELVHLAGPPQWSRLDEGNEIRLWVVRLLTTGLAFLACGFLVGRVSEGLAPGWGGATLVTFTAGTMMSSLAIVTFEEVPVALLGFAAFLLAWRRLPLYAGLVAGAAILCGYQSGLIVLIVGLYLLAARGRLVLPYVLGTAPGFALLATYDWAAFGSPLHLSYRYVSTAFSKEQHDGFFGIRQPSLHRIQLVLFGDRGLIIDAPILALATLGLVLVWRRGYRLEAAVCALVTIAFLAVEFGYFDPYGGDSPGPRFFVPALPFLALGLASSLASWKVVGAALALLSVVGSTAVALTWIHAVHSPAHWYPGTVWSFLYSSVRHGPSTLSIWAPRNVLHWFGVPRDGISAAVIAASSVAALGISIRDGWTTSGGTTQARGKPTSVNTA